ncbi:iron ABC transporter substrate-binding protein [Lysinibacillus contaminans]|uniref:Iron ABC transporter substrate-binding protein n=1 Tax=Lysinibacillus contaminans TaxID=1293441 RepID=A0ABR5JVL7_9BACI|nr:extracellular solute-binding protein [Lysinibacillus contaminans]KOS66185.1 iron ABC transporter substrate-binding protein [Lysinibacillus contaminans]
MKKTRIFGLLLVFMVMILAACSSDDNKDSTSNADDGDKTKVDAEVAPSGKLVIYTGRDEEMVQGVIDQFNEKYPDIEVDFLTMGAQQILERLRGEKANPQADFWWGGTQSALIVGANEDLLHGWDPSFTSAIDATHKDAEGRWFGEMLLPEVIMINSDTLTKETGPQDWDELLDPKWKDQILIRGVLASGTMRTIYSSMIVRQDADTPEKGYDWLLKLDANTKEYTQDPNALYLKLTRQEGSVSLWNLQDILLKKHTTDYPFDYIYPKSGAPILVDGVGVVNNAKNLENAKLFVEFIFEKEMVTKLANDYYQIPTRSDIDKATMPEWYKELDLKTFDIDWELMSEKEAEWMEYWDTNVKGRGK